MSCGDAFKHHTASAGKFVKHSLKGKIISDVEVVNVWGHDSCKGFRVDVVLVLDDGLRICVPIDTGIHIKSE